MNKCIYSPPLVPLITHISHDLNDLNSNTSVWIATCERDSISLVSRP